MNHYLRLGVWAVGAAVVTASIVIAICAAESAAPAKPVQKQLSAEQKQQLDKAAKLAADAHRLNEAGKYRQAVPPAEEALRIRRDVLGPEHPDTAASMNALGEYYSQLGEYSKALPLEQRATEVLRKVLGPEHPDTVVSSRNLAGLHGQMGHYAAALPLLQQTLEIDRKLFGLENPQTAQTIGALANLYWTLGDNAKALSLLQQALQIQRKVLGPEHTATATSLTALADVQASMGNYAKALPLYREALDIHRKALGPEHPDTIRDLRQLGDLYTQVGEYAKARPLLEQALEIDRRTLGPEHPETIQSLNTMGALYESMGDYAAAVPVFQQGLASCRKTCGPEHPNTGQFLNNLALSYQNMGDYAKALPLFQRSIEVLEKTRGAEHPDMSFGLGNLAELYALMGDCARAVQLMQRAVAIDEKVLGPEHPVAVGHLDTLASFYRLQGDFGKALSLCQRVLEVRRKARPDTAGSLGSLARLYDDMGEYGKALPLYQQDLIYQRKRGADNPNTARCLRAFASCYVSMGDCEKALPLLHEAVAKTRKLIGPRHPDTARALIVSAKCYCLLGQYAAAAEAAREAAEIDNEVLADIAPSLADSQAMNVIATKRFWLDGLLSAAFETGAELEGVYALVWQRRGLLLRIGEARRQTALAAGASPEVGRKFADYRAVRAELARLSMTPVGADPKRAQRLTERLKACGERKERLESELARLLPDLGRQLQAERRPPSDLRANLPPGAAFVDFVEYHRLGPLAKKSGTKRVACPACYAAFVLAPGKPTACVDLGSADAINAAIASWSEALAEAKSSPAASTLRQLAWEPIERRLPRETKTVYLCPEGSLTRLCWAALPGRGEAVASAVGTRRVPDTLADGTQRAPAAAERILLEDYALALVPSGQFLLDELTTPGPAPGARGTLLAVGDVTYDAHPAASRPAPLLLASAGLRSAATEGRRLYWPALPATVAELSDVIGAWRAPNANLVRLSRGEAATEQVMAELPHARFAHFATHGFFADKKFRSALQLPEAAFEQADLREGQRATVAARNPLLLSGLVLAGANLPRQNDEFGVPQGDGGILTAEAIAMLPLDKLELAVLSACETGLGDVAGGEGVFGLQRAFHIAGARNVVASLWKVDDQATATLMQLFYRNLWRAQKPLPPIAALREAQLALYRHPQWIEHPELLDRRDGQRGPDLSRPAAPESRRQPGARPTTAPQRLPPKYWAAFVLSGSGQ